MLKTSIGMWFSMHSASAVESITRRRRSIASMWVISGMNVALDILDTPEFRSGDYSTSFLEEAGARLPSFATA